MTPLCTIWELDMARVSDKTKELVTERAKRHCEYCRAPLDFTTDLFAIEHIIPVAEDGGDDADNLALACSGCNMYKHDFTTGIDPATGEFASLFHPRRDVWDIHFSWNHDFSQIVGKTPTGRATVVRLKMNRASVANLRGLLTMFKKHPPFI